MCTAACSSSQVVSVIKIVGMAFPNEVDARRPHSSILRTALEELPGETQSDCDTPPNNTMHPR